MDARKLLGVLAQRLAIYLVTGIAMVMLLHLPEATLGRTFEAQKLVQATTHYLENLARGHAGEVPPARALGYGRQQPAAPLIKSHAPRSAYLLSAALVLGLGLGTVLGVAASRFGPRLTRPFMLTAALGLVSTPDMMLVLLTQRAVGWLIDAFQISFIRTIPVGEMQSGDLVIPALALSAMVIALVARTTAVAFDEIYEQHFIRTARSKGVSPISVVWKHAFRHAWIRVAETGPMVAGSLVTGLMVVEYIFFYPGLGRTLGLMMEGRRLHSAPASSMALVLLLFALAVDLLFGLSRTWVDPRLSADELRPAGRGQFDLRAALQSVMEVPRELWLSLTELPYKLWRGAWAWRPGRLLGLLFATPPLWIGLAGVTTLIFAALFGHEFADLRRIHGVPKYVVVDFQVFFPPFPPGLDRYALGSDVLGRDLLSRLLVGARYTVFFTLAITPLRFLVALPWGLAAGYRQGLWALLSRTLSMILAATPMALVVLALISLQRILVEEETSANLFWFSSTILAAVGIPRLVESIRQQVEAGLVLPFVEGAQAAGASPGRILRKHLIPHLSPQLWVLAAADMAWTMMLLAQLGVFSIFLGGAHEVVASDSPFAPREFMPRLPDWSSMLSAPRFVIYRAPWALWTPALAFMFAVVSFSLVAEGLRRLAQQPPTVPDPEMEQLPGGTERYSPRTRMRLALQWTAALTAISLLSFVAMEYGGKNRPALSVSVTRKPPVELAKDEMLLVLEELGGSGDSSVRTEARKRLPDTVTEYLSAATKERKGIVDIQTDTNGVANVYPLAPTLLLMHVHEEIAEARDGGTKMRPIEHLFFHRVLEQGNSVTSYLESDQFPTYFALVKDGARDVLIVAGTVPPRETDAGQQWSVTAWEQAPSGKWQRSDRALARIHERIPPGLKASLTTKGIRFTVEGDYQLVVRVLERGEIEICKTNADTCDTIPWE